LVTLEASNREWGSDVASLIAASQAYIAQCPITKIPRFDARVSAILPRDKPMLQLFPSVHGTPPPVGELSVERYGCQAATHVIYNTKLRFSHLTSPRGVLYRTINPTSAYVNADHEKAPGKT
jgi:hypothetical protein